MYSLSLSSEKLFASSCVIPGTFHKGRGPGSFPFDSCAVSCTLSRYQLYYIYKCTLQNVKKAIIVCNKKIYFSHFLHEAPYTTVNIISLVSSIYSTFVDVLCFHPIIHHNPDEYKTESSASCCHPRCAIGLEWVCRGRCRRSYRRHARSNNIQCRLLCCGESFRCQSVKEDTHGVRNRDTGLISTYSLRTQSIYVSHTHIHINTCIYMYRKI